MLSIDLNDILRTGLKAGNRPADGMLHPSGDIIGPLRHTMLRMAGAPEKPNSLASMIRLQTGTMWHDYLGELFESRGLPVMREVSATPGLPAGWAGTADLLFWSAEDGGYMLVDVKTTKAAGLPYIERDGAKAEHVAQLSAYWHAFVQMGFPMVNRGLIWYVPMDEDYGVEGGVQPLQFEVTHLWDVEEITDIMEIRRQLVDDYLRNLNIDAMDGSVYYLTDKLADPMPREQKLFKDRDKWNLALVPHWTAMFCPYDDALCNCGGEEGQPKTEKIGHFEARDGTWLYVPRAGYDIEPLLAPKGKVPSA